MEEKQFLLPGTRPGTLAYTNLGMGGVVDQQLRKAGHDFMLETNATIHSYHQRGADELVHRAFKKDVTEPVMPIRSFSATLCRRLVDVAAKVVSHAGRTVLKVTAVAMESLRFKELWERCLSAPILSGG